MLGLSFQLGPGSGSGFKMRPISNSDMKACAAQCGLWQNNVKQPMFSSNRLLIAIYVFCVHSVVLASVQVCFGVCTSSALPILLQVSAPPVK